MTDFRITYDFFLSHPLIKRHPIRSFSVFLWWQLQSRLRPSKFFKKNFIPPLKLFARKGLAGATGNLYAGLHEFNEMGFLLHVLKHGDTFFDIGANIGSYTLLASGICKANSVAFEPVASTFDILAQNIALNQLQDKVILKNAAAGAREGNILFSTGEDTTNHVIADDEPGDPESITVPVLTVDALAVNQPPLLVKIDVEGFETEVLKGMPQLLDSSILKAIIIELNGSGDRYGFNDDAIHQLLISKGFRPCSYDPFSRKLTILSTYQTENIIYCRDLDLLNERVKTAAAIKVMGELI